MRPVRPLGAALAALLLLAPACGGDDDGAEGDTTVTFVALDGSPRVPDAAGIVVDIADDFATIELSGERVYEISPDLQSFSTLDGSTQPLRDRLGQYVHVGLDGDTMVWIAGIGSVVRVPGQPDSVAYRGTLVAVDGDRLTFRDGTVLRAAPDVVTDPGEPVPIAVTIDPNQDLVTAVAS